MKNKYSISVGVDMEPILRFNKLDRVEHINFLSKIYTKRELDYCYSKKNPAPHLAARYVAKEAVLKAVDNMCEKTCKLNILDLKSIEIANNKRRAPEVKIYHKSFPRNITVKVSLSHSKDAAIAFAIAVYNK